MTRNSSIFYARIAYCFPSSFDTLDYAELFVMFFDANLARSSLLELEN